MHKLDIGESRTVEVDPRQHYVATNVVVVGGERYGFQAQGYWQDDWIPPCDANGWDGLFALVGLVARFRSRVPAAQIFQLCASLGRDLVRAFPVGTGLEWAVPHSVGADIELFVFANDWPDKYGNNHVLSEMEGGPMKVTITRLG